MTPARTLLVRICTGATVPGCGREYGRAWIAWTGSPVADTHGICPHCLEREEIARLRGLI